VAAVEGPPVPPGRLLFQLDPLHMPVIHNLEWDPREEHQVDFPHAWRMSRSPWNFSTAVPV
jgi:hypothetical protein